MANPNVTKKSAPPAKQKINSSPAMTILNKCAALKMLQQRESIERKELSVLTGIKTESTIDKALKYLNRQRWLIVTPETLTITPKGFEYAKEYAAKKVEQSIKTDFADMVTSLKKETSAQYYGKQVCRDMLSTQSHEEGSGAA